MLTRMAPMPRLRSVGSGASDIPSSASTTAIPLKSTARLEVAAVVSIDAPTSSPSTRSSRYRVSTNSE